MSAPARPSTPHEVWQALVRADEHEGAHRCIHDLDMSMRDIDNDDLACYVARDDLDLDRIHEFVLARAVEQAEKDERWPN